MSDDLCPCPYCGHAFEAHKEDSACECFVGGCDCNLSKVMGALERNSAGKWSSGAREVE
jgi:hypothetical protein